MTARGKNRKLPAPLLGELISPNDVRDGRVTCFVVGHTAQPVTDHCGSLPHKQHVSAVVVASIATMDQTPITHFVNACDVSMANVALAPLTVVLRVQPYLSRESPGEAT